MTVLHSFTRHGSFSGCKSVVVHPGHVVPQRGRFGFCFSLCDITLPAIIPQIIVHFCHLVRGRLHSMAIIPHIMEGFCHLVRGRLPTLLIIPQNIVDFPQLCGGDYTQCRLSLEVWWILVILYGGNYTQWLLSFHYPGDLIFFSTPMIFRLLFPNSALVQTRIKHILHTIRSDCSGPH